MWPIYHGTTCYLTMCVVRTLSIPLRLVISTRSSSVKSSGTMRRSRGRRHDTEGKLHWEYHVKSCRRWKVGRVLRLVFTLKHFKFANIHVSPPNGSLGVFVNNWGKLANILFSIQYEISILAKGVWNWEPALMVMMFKNNIIFMTYGSSGFNEVLK